jgi:SAM-dependent methyltransferase
MLHIAPEEALRQAFQRLPDIGYVSMDLHAPDILVRADAGRLPFASHVFDFIYCSHVLEHIPDDRAAMRELQRVLRPGGVAMVLVPVWDKPTFEDPGVIDPVERERLFGQFDHVRWYGCDIIDRLSDSGFSVRMIRAGDVADAAVIGHFGLDESDVMFVCTKPEAAPAS